MPSKRCRVDKSRLLAEISKRPSIWDTRINFAVRRPKMLLDWPAVGQAMRCCVEECKRLWKGLRGNYRTEVRRRVGGCRWRYFEEMEFMREVFLRPKEKEVAPVLCHSGGLHFEVAEHLFVVLDSMETGLDMDEEMARQLGSENWLWDPKVELALTLGADLPPFPPAAPSMDIPPYPDLNSNDPDLIYVRELVPFVQSLSQQSRQRFRILARDLLGRVMTENQQGE
ncbi:uncharacterized protein [Drosophila takahashii]|uniref:uncharacterized protein n=1 Tax=Drosophila takahashii TaxID=29030 RepID=UPI00389961E0